MDSTKVWNRIVKQYKDNSHAKEEVLQKDWEQIFSDLFNYSRFFGEIDSHRNIHIGSHQRTIPDIIIRGEHGDLFDVELKQYSMPFSVEMENQLKSYMDLLHISVGVLICQNVYLYIYDFSQSKLKRMEIPFVEGNSDGVRFVELMQRGNFSQEKVEEFIDSKAVYVQNVAAIKASINDSLIRSLLTDYFLKTYTLEEITEALSGDSGATVIDVPGKHNDEPEGDTDNTDSGTNIATDDLRIKLKIGKRVKAEAIMFLRQQGLEINKNVTYACRQEKKDEYWANPGTEMLEKEWFIILNDNANMQLIVLKIPAKALSLKSVSGSGLVVRKDKPHYIDLNIGVDTMVDRMSKVNFTPYVVKSLKY